MPKSSAQLLRLAAATLAIAFTTLAVSAAPKPARPAANPPPLRAAAPVAAVGRVVTNPTVFGVTPILKGVTAPHALAASAAASAAPGEKKLDLHVVFTPSKIYNPATDSYDAVNLRSYAPTAGGVAGEFVAPTIPVVPGDTIHIVLHNDLPDDPSCNTMAHMPVVVMDTPHCFNGTNLHSHGLWVSPTGNGDNVLLMIAPHQTFEYIYNIPSDHPAGTFWYHTHLHGSTALQVSSGMAGAIIIRGSRLPTPNKHGDIDTLLKLPDGSAVPEQLLVMQQIQYGCLDKDHNIKADAKGAWICENGDIGTVGPFEGKPLPDGTRPLGYEDANGRGYGPNYWIQSGRYTSINGVVLPTFTAKAGQIQRWRMIHAGVRDTISLRFYHMAPKAPKLEGLAAADNEKFIDANCIGDPIPYHIMAQDGLTTGAAQRTTIATFQPGYRVDALVIFPSDGNYCVVDASSSAASSVNRDTDPGRLLGKVTVSAGAPVTDIGMSLRDQLIAAAQHTMPAGAVRDRVVADLKDGLKLTSFVPHPDIAPAEVTGHQYLTFKIDVAKVPTAFEVGTDTRQPFANPDTDPDKNYPPRSYDHDRVDRYLTLGGVDQWTLQSLFVSHPFHIHVNPFQIVAILDPTGKDVSGTDPDVVDDYALDANGKPIKSDKPDPQYHGLKGTWKDTLWVKNINPTSNPLIKPDDARGMYTLIVRTRYERYIGEFVLHCHILDHEDQGMMQNVEIVPPGYHAPEPMGGMNH